MPKFSHLPLEVQKEAILDIIRHNAENFTQLEEALAEIKVKPQAVIAVLDEHSRQFSPEVIAALHHKRITTHIGGVKTRELVIAGEKTAGTSEGRLVQKALLEEEVATAKHENTWMQKNGPLIRLEKGAAKTINRAEEICEYIGANLMYEIYAQMGRIECSPKIRLHKNTENNVTLLSRFIPNFSTIRELRARGKYDTAEKHKAKGFALFFIANLLVGDYDLYGANVGFRKVNGKKYWARVDLGRSLSYYAGRSEDRYGQIGFTSEPYSVTGFSFLMYSNNRGKALYEPTDFYSFEFGCELLRIENALDTSHFEFILKQTFRNIREAYGDGWLQEKSVVKVFSRGMRLSGELTEEVVIDRILSNINNLREGLQKKGREKVVEIFPHHTDLAIEAYNACANEDGWDSASFFNQLTAVGVDIADRENFNLKRFLQFSSTPNGTEKNALLYDILMGAELSTVQKLLDHPDITEEMLRGCINNMVAKPEYRNNEVAILIAGHAKSRVFIGGLMKVALQRNDGELYRWLGAVDRELPKKKVRNEEENILPPEALYNLAEELFPKHTIMATDCYNDFVDTNGIVNNRNFLAKMMRGGADLSKRENFDLKRFLEVTASNTGKTQKKALHSVIGGNDLSFEAKLFCHPDIDKSMLMDYLYGIIEDAPYGKNTALAKLLLSHIEKDYAIEGNSPISVLLDQYKEKKNRAVVNWLQDVESEFSIWGSPRDKPSPQVHSVVADEPRGARATIKWGAAYLSSFVSGSAKVAPGLE